MLLFDTMFALLFRVFVFIFMSLFANTILFISILFFAFSFMSLFATTVSFSFILSFAFSFMFLFATASFSSMFPCELMIKSSVFAMI